MRGSSSGHCNFSNSADSTGLEGGRLLTGGLSVVDVTVTLLGFSLNAFPVLALDSVDLECLSTLK